MLKLYKKKQQKAKNTTTARQRKKRVAAKHVMHPYVSLRMMTLLCGVDVAARHRPQLKIVAVVRHVRPQSGRSLILGHGHF